MVRWKQGSGLQFAYSQLLLAYETKNTFIWAEARGSTPSQGSHFRNVVTFNFRVIKVNGGLLVYSF